MTTRLPCNDQEGLFAYSKEKEVKNERPTKQLLENDRFVQEQIFKDCENGRSSNAQQENKLPCDE